MTTNIQLQQGRPTIGMLLHDMSEYHQAIWSGVADTTQEHDVNFITFSGAMLQDPRAFMGQGNILYDLATAESLDGLIIVKGCRADRIIDGHRMQHPITDGSPLAGDTSPGSGRVVQHPEFQQVCK